mmetsp:Transcript_163/g.394  ORF Transcript_163/g.394 Transcript_163/m.394 type:complete len:126 (-) Transcript_163:235-612(-)
MRCRPALVIDPLWEKLTSLGLSDETLSTPAAECAQSKQKAAVAERKTKAEKDRTIKVEKLKSEIGIREQDGVVDLFEPISDKVETLEGLTVPQIRTGCCQRSTTWCSPRRTSERSRTSSWFRRPI